MPVVRINDATFADLKSIATWFGTKTPSQTIDRIVQEALEQLGMERDEEPQAASGISSDNVTEFGKAPGLSFTKPVSASVNNKPLGRVPWLRVLLATIAQVKAKGFEGDRLAGELHVPAKSKRHEGNGFKYYPELGISIQGQSTPDAWKEIDRIAKKYGIPVIVEFSWSQNPKAQFPGRTGVLRSAC